MEEVEESVLELRAQLWKGNEEPQNRERMKCHTCSVECDRTDDLCEKGLFIFSFRLSQVSKETSSPSLRRRPALLYEKAISRAS